VTHELETAGLCVDSLRVLAEADPEKARRLLHRRLESSIETLYRFPVSAFEGEAAIPNLELAAARSVEYLEQSASPLAERAGAVRDRLR
jgi:hypothetical protein